MPQYKIPPKPKNDKEFLELIARIIFVIGFRFSIVEERWPKIKKAFHNFDVDWVKNAKMEKIVEADGMIKNKMKIQRIIDNAKKCSDIIEENGSMMKWVEKIDKESKESLLNPSLEEACQQFNGIGEMTSKWVASVSRGDHG